MKRYFLFILLAIFSIACQKEDEGKIREKDEKPIVEESSLPLLSTVRHFGSDYKNSVLVENDTTIRISLLPGEAPINKGEVILFMPGDNTEYVFVGKVTRIERQTDMTDVIYHTTMPSINEVLDIAKLSTAVVGNEFYFTYDADKDEDVESIEYVDDTVWDSIDHVVVKDAVRGGNNTQTKGSIDGLTLPVNIPTLKIGVRNNYFSGCFYVKIKGNIYIKTFNDLEVSFTVTTGINGALESELSGAKDIQLWRSKFPIKFYSNGILSLQFTPAVLFRFAGSISFKSDLNFEISRSEINLKYQGGNLSNNSTSSLGAPSFTVFHLDSEGKFGPALNGTMGLIFMHSDLLSLGFNLIAGAYVSGSKTIGIQFPGNENPFNIKVLIEPYMETTPYIRLASPTGAQSITGKKVYVSGKVFEKSLLPQYETSPGGDKNYIEIGYRQSNSECFIDTKESGLALFKKGTDTPVKKEPIKPQTRASSYESVLTYATSNKNDYEYAEYAIDDRGKIGYGEKKSVISFRDFLIAMYKSCNGEKWHTKENWCTDKPLNEWSGVESKGDYYSVHVDMNGSSGNIDFNGCRDAFEFTVHHFKGDACFCNSGLQHLECSFTNQLTSLDVSGCSNLQELNCCANQLTSLNISGCPNLQVLSCYDNKLASLDVSGCSNLQELDCNFNQLTNLNISGCSNLQELNCCANQLTSLNISGCSSLQDLNCGVNQLTSLDAGGCPKLQYLMCYDNRLASLNVTGCSSLQHLDCIRNQITSLNVKGYSNLQYLSCGENKLTSLDISGCSSLQELSCEYNQLTSLNISECSSLQILYCENNQITSLDAGGCSKLQYLWCYDNRLASLNVTGCSSLQNLNCERNQITSLNVKGYSNLQHLSCGENKLTSLDISGCLSLRGLSCFYNQLTSLDASGCSNLEYLGSLDNELMNLNITGCSSLEKLWCSNSQLTNLNISGCSSLQELLCYNCKLTSLNASGCSSLLHLDCHANHLTSLNISGCSSLQDLDCTSNKINSEIPEYFDDIRVFYHDIKYTTYRWGYDGSLYYDISPYGWWYPGEPQSGIHKRTK